MSSKTIGDTLTLHEFEEMTMEIPENTPILVDGAQSLAHALIDDYEPHSKEWRDKFKSIGGNGEVQTRHIFTNNDYSYCSLCKECDEKYFCFRRTKIHCDYCGNYLQWKENHN